MKHAHVHPLAQIDPFVTIGEGCQIWRFTHVQRGASIGAHTTIGGGCYIGKDVIIGEGCRIQNNVYIPEDVSIGNNVFIGPGVTFTNVKYPCAWTSHREKFLATKVYSSATIGANATILPGISIYPYAFIGAGAVVTKDVKGSHVVAGNPARFIRWATPGEPLKPKKESARATVQKIDEAIGRDLLAEESRLFKSVPGKRARAPRTELIKGVLRRISNLLSR